MKTGRNRKRLGKIDSVRSSGFWQAWRSDAADVRAEAWRVLSCGALEEAKRVFLTITGKDGDIALPEVQRAMGELTVLLDKEADVTLHVSSEKNFAAGAI